MVLALDEAVTADLIGLYESRALSEAGKWGLEFHILIQNPFGFGSDEIRTGVLQNCWRHEWFRQGNPEAARLAAEDIVSLCIYRGGPRAVLETFVRGESVYRAPEPELF